jgi:hypothetical protein
MRECKRHKNYWRKTWTKCMAHRMKTTVLQDKNAIFMTVYHYNSAKMGQQRELMA